MSEGMAKSAPAPVGSAPTISPRNPTLNIPISYEGIPVDLMNYFDQGFDNMTQRSTKQLGEIYVLLKDDFNNMGDLLYEVKQIERRLGPAPLSETRYGRVWNWLKVSNRIKKLEKERQAFVNG